MELEVEAREVLERMKGRRPGTKEEIRNVLLSRKREIGSIGGPGGGTMGRLNALVKSCDLLHVPFDDVKSEQPRGVYFAELAPNSRDFLLGQDNTMQLHNKTEDEISEWWLDRWYSMRLPKVREEIDSFDYSVYKWDNQIDLCSSSVNGDTSVSQAEESGSIPESRLQLETV